MNVGLIISTYQQPRFLQLVLKSVLEQSVLPQEIIVADDGSGKQTEEVVNRFQDLTGDQSELNFVHCWQADLGFRKTRILNRAIQTADSEYLIFSDGDMVLHRKYVQDHIAIAKPGRFTQGRRICLNGSASQRHLNSMACRISPFERGLNRRLQIIRHKWLKDGFSSIDCSLKNSRGCNQAFWKQDLIRVNGYEEKMEGWGREDSELCARLHNIGLKRIYARHWALAFHLNHPEASREHDQDNLEMLQQSIENRKTRADVGITESNQEDFQIRRSAA